MLEGHTDAVNRVGAVPVADRTLLASASSDGTVRLWDPATGRPVRSIPVHHPAGACVYAVGVLVAGLTGGLLAVQLHE